MKRDCASTCKFCDVPKPTENSTDVKQLRLPNGLRFRQQLTRTTAKNTTSDGKDCEERQGKKCVFPAEKRLTTTPGSTRKPEDAIKQLTTASRSQKLVLIVRPTGRNETTVTNRRAFTPPSLNKKLVEYLRGRNRSATASTTDKNLTTVVYNVSVVSPVTESYEVRKVKLEELMNTTANLPRIATAEIETFTVSLSKTLIKGKCLDEFTYCREFSSLCMDPTFNDVMARHCTLTCKRCDEVELEDEYGAECFDITPDCQSHLELCKHKKYSQLMKDSCAKSCKLCKPACRDRHQNCPHFVEDGFCEDETYTTDERTHLCGASCKSC